MTLRELIEIADQGYGAGGLLLEFFDVGCKRGKVGDTLAEFIVFELQDTYDAKATDEAQLDEASRVMERASEELIDVVDAFEKRWHRQWRKDGNRP